MSDKNMKVSDSLENFTPEQLKVIKDSIDELIKNKESYEIVENVDTANDLLTSENWFIAVREGDIDAVKVFINHKFDVNTRHSERESTALMFASSNGKHDIVKLLVENGADVNVKNNDGNTALYFALIGSSSTVNIMIIKTLVKYGAYVNVKCKDPETFLHIALIKRKYSVIELFVKKGADVNKKNDNGETPLSYASKYCSNETCQILIDAGANIEKDTRFYKKMILDKIKKLDK